MPRIIFLALAAAVSAFDSLTPQDSAPVPCVDGQPCPAAEKVLDAHREWGVRLPEDEGSLDDPLHAAIIRGSVEGVNAALADGASLTTRDALGYTPLHRASDDGQVDILRVLLRHGAASGPLTDSVGTSQDSGRAIDSRDHNAATPLMLAAAGGHVECIRLLVKSGAGVEHGDEFGLTALHYAAEGGHGAAITALLEEGAPLDQGDDAGKTALDVARAWGFTEAAAVLRAAGPEIAIEEAAPDRDDGYLAAAAMKMPDNLQPEKLEL